MNRRDFIKKATGLLAAIPALAWLKPERPEVKSPKPKVVWGKGTILEITNRETGERHTLNADSGISLYRSNWVAPTSYGKLARWNSAGDSWGSLDNGKTWTQTGFAPTFEARALCISGDLLEESPEEYRRQMRDYLEQSQKAYLT